MATLKEHQAAMVDLLANGSGIPASESRLAHAMHDVLEVLTGSAMGRDLKNGYDVRCDATTPGLNDKALSKPKKALKTDSPAKWPTPAEQRVKELENTIRQLKANNAKLRQQIAESAPAVDLWNRWSATPPEQLPDEKTCEHGWVSWSGGECPLAADTVVEYEMRDGTGHGEFVEAGDLRWIHKNWHGDIVKYRIVIGAVL